MVKLDAGVLRYMSKDDFRVLSAIEQGMRNHDLVPVPLITRISALKDNTTRRILRQLHKNKLIRHESVNYDGYRLTYGGYDYLALHTFVQRGLITGIGRRIGVGKESDIYECTNADDQVLVIKIHRLGRVCFRNVKTLRDYLQHRQHASWLYLSRLAASREYSYMKALYDHGFPVPTPYDWNRHCVLMSKVEAYPLGSVTGIRHVSTVYNTLINLVVRLAEHGLIHCDFNEFNLMINDDETITMIDFPQMVSTSHYNAEMYFDRDIQGIQALFRKKFHYTEGETPIFSRDASVEHNEFQLDVEMNASGNANANEKKMNQWHVEQFNSLISGRQTLGHAYDEDGSEDEDELEQQLDAHFADKLMDDEKVPSLIDEDTDAKHGEVVASDDDQSSGSDESGPADDSVSAVSDKDHERRERSAARRQAARQKQALRIQRKMQQQSKAAGDHQDECKESESERKAEAQTGESSDQPSDNDDAVSVASHIDNNAAQREHQLELIRQRIVKQSQAKASNKNVKHLVKVNINRTKNRKYASLKKQIAETLEV